MQLMAWFLTIGLGLAGLALREQGGIAFVHAIGTVLLILGGLACPLFWARESGMLDWVGATRRDRLMFGFAFVLATPLILPWL